LNAGINIVKILPSDCRKYPLDNSHYLNMARACVKEYEREISEGTG
jgi:hypothetical protein